MSKKYLRRYVDLPALIYLLSEQRMTLLDPQSWDDSNDSYYLALYREKKKLKSVLALCFTQTSEAYHHWRVFAGGSSGVCIRFNRSKLLKAAEWKSGIRTGPIRYLTLERIRDQKPAIEDLPFLKRIGYEHEAEYRIIYESNTEKKPKLDVAVPLSCRVPNPSARHQTSPKPPLKLAGCRIFSAVRAEKVRILTFLSLM